MNKMIWLVVGVIVFTLSLIDVSYCVEFTESGFIQTQFENHDNANDTFKLLRARPKLRAVLGEHVVFFVQLDLAGDRILKDVWMELDYCTYAKLRVGQFTLPFGWQTPVSPYNLLTINYSNVVSKLNGGGDLRDVGMMLRGNLTDSNIPVLESLNYAVALVNGEGTGSNIAERNDQKNVVGRVGLAPLEGLDLGVSAYFGERGVARKARERVGVDARFTLANLLIQGEFIQSSDETDATLSHTVEGMGYFVEAGYKITPQIQPVCKFDVWDPEVTGTYGSLTKIAVGLNWYIDEWTKLQGIYEIKGEEENEVDDNSFIIQLGLAF